MRLKASAAVLLLTVLSLAACATPGDPGQPTSPPSESAAPSPEPSPDVEQDDPSTWVITDDGMGPVTLGDPFPDALAAMPSGTTNDLDRCATVAWWSAPESAYQVYAAHTASTAADGPIDVVATEAWPDPSIAVGPRTVDGIGIGSSVDEVRAAYPTVAEVPDSIDSSIVHLQVGHIFFSYREEPVISSVTVTTRSMPPYEVCG